MISEVLYCSNKLVFVILRFIILEPIQKKMIQIHGGNSKKGVAKCFEQAFWLYSVN